MDFDKKLTIALEQEKIELAKLPKPWGVLYVHPNPDDSRKKCDNCMMWAKDDTCNIHAANVKITAEYICGYHVFGKPMEERMEHEGMEPVDPKLSGLEEIDGGTSCDICTFYEDGKCLAVIGDNGKPADVEPKGCCARWESS